MIVFLVVFIDLLGFGIVLPLLPWYAVAMLEPLMPGEANRPMRGLVLGLLMSSFSAMQFLFAPIWGRISDRIGRRWIVLVGLGGSVVSYTIFGMASEVAAGGQLAFGLFLLFAARIGAGIAGATISTAQAVIADTTPPEKRAHGMALIGAAFGIGFTFGPLLGFASLLVPLKGAPGFAAAGFSLLALILAFTLLPETLRPGGPAAHRHWLDLQGMHQALRMPTVGALVLTFFLATIAFAGLESTLALINLMLLNPGSELRLELTAEGFEAMQGRNFLIFAYIGFVLMLMQGLVYRRLVRRVGEVRFLQVGTLLMGLGLAGAAGFLQCWQQWTTLAVWSTALLVMTLAVIGFACLTPSVQALISRRSDPARQGEILGVNQSGAALARILGPVLALELFHLGAAHALPYVVGAGLLAVVFGLTLRLGPD
jgi:MFS family permease